MSHNIPALKLFYTNIHIVNNKMLALRTLINQLKPFFDSFKQNLVIPRNLVINIATFNYTIYRKNKLSKKMNPNWSTN